MWARAGGQACDPEQCMAGGVTGRGCKGLVVVAVLVIGCWVLMVNGGAWWQCWLLVVEW